MGVRKGERGRADSLVRATWALTAGTWCLAVVTAVELLLK